MAAPRSGSSRTGRTRRSGACRPATSRPISSATASPSRRMGRSRSRGPDSTSPPPSTSRRAAAGWLAESGVAPGDRIGVIGGSYGGFMTLAAITFCAERKWAAAVDIVGIASFKTFFARTAPWRRPLRAAEYGDPEKDADFLESISPLNFIDRIQAPLMVIHGANDPRVPVQEAEQIVSTLRSRGREVDYLRYEDEGHGLAKAKNRADAWPKVVQFFQKHMRPAT